MSDEGKTDFGSIAPFAWGLVAATTLGIFFGTLFLNKKKKS